MSYHIYGCRVEGGGIPWFLWSHYRYGWQVVWMICWPNWLPITRLSVVITLSEKSATVNFIASLCVQCTCVTLDSVGFRTKWISKSCNPIISHHVQQAKSYVTKCQQILKQVLSKVTWEECVATPNGTECTRPLHALAVPCSLQSNPVTQLWVCYIHTTSVPWHIGH